MRKYYVVLEVDTNTIKTVIVRAKSITKALQWVKVMYEGMRVLDVSDDAIYWYTPQEYTSRFIS